MNSLLSSNKINHFNMAGDFARYRDGLLYYWNRAEELYRGAQIIRQKAFFRIISRPMIRQSTHIFRPVPARNGRLPNRVKSIAN